MITSRTDNPIFSGDDVGCVIGTEDLMHIYLSKYIYLSLSIYIYKYSINVCIRVARPADPAEFSGEPEENGAIFILLYIIKRS